MSAVSDPFPLRNHQASLKQYLDGIVFPAASVAGRIIEERLPAHEARASVRPSLVLWACSAGNGDQADALPVAAAFDLFDHFLLLHEELTNGPAATVTQWGLGQSLNTGDALYALAFRSLASDVVNPHRRLEVAKLVGQAVLEAIEARDERARAASLTGAALAAGARIAGFPEHAVRAFADAGRRLSHDAKSAVAALRPFLSRDDLAVFKEIARYIARQDA
jgi:hypothetical protein